MDFGEVDVTSVEFFSSSCHGEVDVTSVEFSSSSCHGEVVGIITRDSSGNEIGYDILELIMKLNNQDLNHQLK